jgi:hypothetical protein
MTQRKVQFSDILYNPEFGGFQTRATIHEGGVAYVYPAYILATLTADYDYVVDQLTEKTLKMHANRKTSMHLRRDMPVQESFVFPPQAA